MFLFIKEFLLTSHSYTPLLPANDSIDPVTIVCIYSSSISSNIGISFGNPTGWTHIAYVIYGSNNSNHKIYINGVSQTLTNNGGAHGGTAGWTLGANSASGEYWFGKIANAQLYNIALSADQIMQNYNYFKHRFGK